MATEPPPGRGPDRAPEPALPGDPAALAAGFQALVQIAAAGAAAADEDQLIASTTQIVGQALYPDHFGILLLGAAGALTVHPSYQGIRPEQYTQLIPLGMGVCGRVAADGRPRRIGDISQVADYIDSLAGIQSELCVPMAAQRPGGRQEILGVINAESRKRDAFTQDDENLLTIVAGYLATALQKIRLLNAEKQRREEAEALREAALALVSDLDAERLLGSILEQLSTVVAFDSACIFLRLGDELVAMAGRGFDSLERVVGQHYPAADNELARLMHETRQPVIVDDAAADPRFKRWGDSNRTRGWMGVPLAARGGTIGFLTLDRFTPSAYTPEDAALATTFAAHAALALENARLYAQANRRANSQAALNAITGAAVSAPDLQQLLITTLTQILHALGLNDGCLVYAGSFAVEGRCSSLPMVAIPDPAAGAPWLVEDARRPQPPVTPGVAALNNLAASAGLLAYAWALLGAEPRRAQAQGYLLVGSDQPRPWHAEDVALLQTASHQIGMAAERLILMRQTIQRLDRLAALSAIDVSITASLDLRVTLNILLDQVLSRLDLDAGAIYLAQPRLGALRFSVGRGLHPGAERSGAAGGSSLANSVAAQRKLLVLPDIRQATPQQRSELQGLGGDFAAYIGAPLIAKGEIKGVIELFKHSPLQTDPEWLEFVETISAQAAIAIENLSLYNDLQRSNLDLHLAYDATLEGWARAQELRDPGAAGHARRVADLTLQFARRLGLPEERLAHIRRGALLHDLGMLGIPDEILQKPGPLSEDEWLRIRQHPQHAHDILWPVAFLRPALQIPYSHHERWDGSGYPRRLAGSAIPEEGRLFAIVDVWDSLCTDRPYRRAWNREAAAHYLHEQAGQLFDPHMAPEFLRLLADTG